ncbi:MAG: isoaspartyl peptidase/L-asparaginase [Candidatus Bathyarchaeota archaeon]|nr:isoaspartyl peptidase/L-asparaginase [Candidatus Bathyarchaeota archaeon]
MVKPFLVGSDSAEHFLHIGAEILRKHGTSLDAVEASCRAVEANPERDMGKRITDSYW